MTVLVYLCWPEKCFRANGDDLRYLRSLLPRGAKVVEAKSERAFLAALPRATHVITWHFKADWYALAPKLVLVATPAAGRELVAVPVAGREPVATPAAGRELVAVPVAGRGFAVSCPDGKASAPSRFPKIHFGGFHGAIISETVLAFVLAYAHGFFATKPLWPRSLRAADVLDVSDTRAVIAGYGRIGRAIGERLSGFGISVRGLSHAECDQLKGKGVRRNPSSLIPHFSFLKSADWFILALPSDTGTDDFLDAKLLSRLPKKCVVINIGRGNAIDERALLAALRRGRIAAAYLDVFKHEPTQIFRGERLSDAERKSDIANLSAAELPRNLIRTPHGSAFSPGYIKAAFKELKDEKLI